MSSKATSLLTALAFVVLATLFEGLTLWQGWLSNEIGGRIKQQAVEIIQLPDLAIVTEATWLRHRSLATPFAVFPEDGALLDYYPSTFVYKISLPQSDFTLGLP